MRKSKPHASSRRSLTARAAITSVLLILTVAALPLFSGGSMHVLAAGAISSSPSAAFPAGKAQAANVKSYGAVGNGYADDTAAIQKAVNGAANGIVYFPAGTYIISTVKLKNNTALVSDNLYIPYSQWKSEAVLKAKSGSKCMLNLQGVSGVSIGGLTLDGNKKKSSGISGGGHTTSIANCKIFNCLYGLGCKYAETYDNNVFTAYIHGCMFDTCSAAVVNTIDSKIDGNYIGNGVYGLATMSDTIISGNTIHASSQYGIRTQWAAHCVITGNHIEGCGYAGLYIDSTSSHDTVTANIFSGNGASASGQGSCDVLLQSTSDIVLRGNTTKLSANGKAPAYSFVITDSGSIVISSNTFSPAKFIVSNSTVTSDTALH